MKQKYNLKTAMVGFLTAGVLAFGATAYAATFDAGIFAVGNGDAANPISRTFTGSSLTGFLDTVNFDLGSFTHFNMTSQLTNVAQGTPGVLGAFGTTIFRNNGDVEIDLDGTDLGGGNIVQNNYHGIAESFTNVQLPNLGLTRDYHLHPQGTYLSGGGSYTITLWGSNGPGGPAVPLPAAAWLFGSGVIGLAGLARRKMAA